MRNGCLWQNAMAQIENERAGGKCFENGVRRAIERRTARQQSKRIKIALNRKPRLNMIACKFKTDRPIESQYVDRNLLHISEKACADPARKTYELRIGNFGSHFRDDLLSGPYAPSVKTFIGQKSCPCIENLNCIRSSFELIDEMRC